MRIDRSYGYAQYIGNFLMALALKITQTEDFLLLAWQLLYRNIDSLAQITVKKSLYYRILLRIIIRSRK